MMGFVLGSVVGFALGCFAMHIIDEYINRALPDDKDEK